MCPAKWQTQYHLTEKMTPANTRALLLILEKIENNTEVEIKPPNAIKPKGAEGKCRMELIDSSITKKSKEVGFSDKQCAQCKKHGGLLKSNNAHDCHRYNPDRTPIKRNEGAGSTRMNRHNDKNHSNLREHTGANFAPIVCKEVRKSSVSSSTSARNVLQMIQKGVILTTAHEAMGWIAQGNYICVRNLN